MSYTVLALIAFAANSLLCRVALRDGAIDPASFSAIRLAAGAVTLLLVTAAMGPPSADKAAATGFSATVQTLTGKWLGAVMLFLYAVPFSFAYTHLSAGTGALILFGSVQLTMLGAALRSGERPHLAHWMGFVIAAAGLVYLVLPGVDAPSAVGAALMMVAGISWGAYSLRGRLAANPLAQTTTNFARAVPLAAVVSVVALPAMHIEPRGIVLAVASGALASGLGYVAWYEALKELTSARAAIAQLVVPILAAVGGVIFLAEAISARLVISTAAVLGGVALALRQAQSRMGRGPHRGIYVVMGVAGSGKSLIGAALAKTLGVGFVEGDDYHPPENVARMARGVPLTDDDRAGWLSALAERIRDARQAGAGLVVTCSALKRSYREALRAHAPDLRFVFLHGPKDLIATRLAGRRGHFMNPALLDSQFATLEKPLSDESVWHVDVDESPEKIVSSLAARAST